MCSACTKNSHSVGGELQGCTSLLRQNVIGIEIFWGYKNVNLECSCDKDLFSQRYQLLSGLNAHSGSIVFETKRKLTVVGRAQMSGVVY